MPQPPAFDPIADPAAVVIAGNARFTVLTSRLIRMEFAGDGRFEDRASQPFWYRRQPVPPFTATRAGEELVLQTEHLRLRYAETGGFAADGLSVELLGTSTTWHYGDADTGNLLGTTRTLDKVSGATRLEPGLLSRSGWVVVDDSATLVFDDAGWLQPRGAAVGSHDLYFFGYGHDYRACLRDFTRVAGKTPLLPRWALGNWWSRYWPYSAEDLRALINDFRAHDVPLAVCIIDMDWHLVDVGPGISGWTGYTWNRELFPDPPAFMAWLHEQGLRTALNLHPALGVRNYEEAYPAMALRLGIDPESGATIPFDIADPAFTAAYFEVLHHPQEADGVDFWWMDWQQGQRTSLAGLDPLWWLNHLHYNDLGRDGKRPFTFSRWGGLGNHRYPIGFSGDTQVTWDSLAFQPYFTATAANVGYSWWSHDIGGHMQGVEDRELYTRWVQFGVFSPIFRLHSTQNPYHDRRPWGYDAEVLRITRDAMQLRHALIPYLYSNSWHNETADVAMIRPLYHDYPEHDAAYACPQASFFGNDLIVAPYTSAADADTRLARQVVWLPPGDWYDFFTGRYFAGNAWYALHGRLEDIPVLARAGAIVPLGPRVGWGGIDVPDALDIVVFTGADGRFTLFEDSGEGLDYRHGAHVLTTISQTWAADEATIVVHAPEGDSRFVPEQRQIVVHVVGVGPGVGGQVQLGGVAVDVATTYDRDRERLTLSEVVVPRGVELRITIRPSADAPLLARRDRSVEMCLNFLNSFRMESNTKLGLAGQLTAVAADPSVLDAYELELKPSQTRAILETLLGAGGHVVKNQPRPNLVVLWNNHDYGRVRYRYVAQDDTKWFAKDRFHAQSGPVVRSMTLLPEVGRWQATVLYGDVIATPLHND